MTTSATMKIGRSGRTIPRRGGTEASTAVVPSTTAIDHNRAPAGISVRLLACIPLLFVALVVAACGGSSDDEQEGPTFDSVLAQVEALTGKAREDKLLKLAEAEDADLSFYTSMSSNVEEEVVSAFEDEYDLGVAVYRASSGTVLQRLLEEANAGFHGADVVESSGLEMLNLQREGVLVPYDSPLADGLVSGTRNEGWTTDRFNTFVVSWNTDLVEPDEAPKSWEELADPKWRGQLGLEAGDVDWYKTLWEYWVEVEGKTPEEADKLFQGMARNALFVPGHTVMGQLQAAGEFALAVNYLHTNLNLIADGAPLAWRPAVEPIIPRANGIGLVDGAEHPASALLFTDWLLSKGQVVLGELNVDPTRKDLAAGPGIEEVKVNLPSLADEQEKWTEQFDQLTTLGKEVPESEG
jgi:iron(III) transport system substrate-binding protein